MKAADATDDRCYQLNSGYEDGGLRLAKVVAIKLCIFDIGCSSIDIRGREAADSA